MDIKDLLNAAMNKDANTFESAFSQIMAGKMEAAIGSKYDAMFSEAKESDEDEMEDEDENDEDEDDDEDKEDDE